MFFLIILLKQLIFLPKKNEIDKIELEKALLVPSSFNSVYF